MELHSIRNYRQIKVKFLGPTNTRGARVKIYEPKRWNSDKVKAVTLSYDYEIGCIAEQCVKHLQKIGMDRIAGRCSDTKSYTFLIDSWGEDFVELSK